MTEMIVRASASAYSEFKPGSMEDSKAIFPVCGARTSLEQLADICATSEKQRAELSVLAKKSRDPLIRFLYASRCVEVIPSIIATHDVQPCPFEGDSCTYVTSSPASARPPFSPIQPPAGIRRSSRIARSIAKKTAKAVTIVVTFVPPPPPPSPSNAQSTRSLKRKREQSSEEDKQQQHVDESKSASKTKVKRRKTAGKRVENKARISGSSAYVPES